LELISQHGQDAHLVKKNELKEIDIIDFMKIAALIVIIFFDFCSGYAQKTDSILHEEKIVPWFVERFKISAGFFYVVNNTNVQVGITGDPGTNIDYEKDLGFTEDVGNFLSSFQWRISSRSRLSLSYYRINRNSVHTLNKEIIFNDSIYPANASVNANFNTGIYQFSYGYAILSKPKYELGLLIGAHIVGAKTEISLVGTNSGVSFSNNFGFTAPIPDLGIWGGYAFNNRLAINFDTDYLSATIGNKSGRVLSTNLTVNYRLIDNLDLSLGYAGLNFKVNAVRQNIEGLFKWGYNGPALAINFSFGKNRWMN